ncbi:MAG: STAS domain-containing protein [Bacteroidota bacterium]
MNVKIDTKERFTVFTPQETNISANMTGELSNMLLSYLQKDIPHIVLNLSAVESMDEESGKMITMLQQQFYESNCSLVICELQPNVETMLDKEELLEIMNVTPTESEAWDILQMEEIEREMFGDN